MILRGLIDCFLFLVGDLFLSNSNVKAKSPARNSVTDSSSSSDSDTTQYGSTPMTLPYYTSPVKWVPHAGQRAAVKFLLNHAAAGLFLSPGSGKTSVVLSVFKKLLESGVAEKMLVVAPLRPANLVWGAEASKWLEFKNLRVVVLHGKDKQRLLESGEYDVAVINYEGLPWLLGAVSTASFGGKRKSVSVDVKRFKAWGFDTLVMDECFVAGTPILTPYGDKPIESLRVGDMVMTHLGPRRVTRSMRRTANDLVEMGLGNGGKIRTTRNHPIYTGGGWKNAELCLGERVYTYTEVQSMRNRVSETLEPRCLEISAQGYRPSMLQLLQSETNAREKSWDTRACERAYARYVHRAGALEQRCVVAGGFSPSVLRTSENIWASNTAGASRRQWSWPFQTRISYARNLARDVYLELHCAVGRAWKRLSDTLQVGFWESRGEDGNRGGRGKSLRPERAGSEERGQVGGTWVDSVTRVEQDSGQDVWNLSVEEAETYFAHGVLVHNCSRLKHTNTTTFKAIKHVLPTFARRWGLTGSPVSNGLQDIFGQMLAIDGGRSFGPYVTHFRNQYCVPHPSGFGWKMQEGSEKRIYDRIRPVVLRQNAADYTDMPDLISRRIDFDLPKNIRAIYDTVEDELFAALEDGNVVAANAAAAASKCRQIVNGGVYLDNDIDSDDDRRKWTNLHTEKVDLLAELLDELQGEPVFVAYEFVHDLDRLLRRFGKNTPYIGGGVSTKRADEIVRLWNQGEIPLLLAHPAAAGHGLNLQNSGAQVCFHSLTYDLEKYEQFIGRIHRQGQKAKRVFVHHILAKKTIDDAMWFALHNKSKGQQALFEALKQRRRG